jgi:hypothetical protein
MGRKQGGNDSGQSESNCGFRCVLHMVHDSNREAYRELARAGLMVAGNSLAGGQESVYHVTNLGRRRIVAHGLWQGYNHPPGSNPRSWKAFIRERPA